MKSESKPKISCSTENILEQQNMEIKEHIFQPIQKIIMESTDTQQTELEIGLPANKHELGLINPEVDFNNDYKFEGTAKMKQRLSNRYINDYNLFKNDPGTKALRNYCPNSGTNCDASRLINYEDNSIITIENSLRFSEPTRDDTDGPPEEPNQKEKNIRNLILDQKFDTEYPMFGTDFRQKKSCMEPKSNFDIFNVTVPRVLDDYVLDNTIINSREYIRSIAHDNEGVFH
tara:strand:- start:1966 stop:2658 length:693 start_codon:yes stop_codon:yes gene_type:complete